MAARHEYQLILSTFRPLENSILDSTIQINRLRPSDAEALAQLMLFAYRGTIDDDGETIEDARAEIAAFLNGERGGPPLPNLSRLAFIDEQLVGACLISYWADRNMPIIGYVLTHPNWKQRGLGRLLLNNALSALREEGYQEVRAMITTGNIPSERLLGGAGFQRI